MMMVNSNIQGGPNIVGVDQDSVPIERRVVSWALDGSPVSDFADNVWDFSAYSPNTKVRRFNFDHWCKSKSSHEEFLIVELKRLMYFIIWMRHGYQLSITTVRHYFDLLVLICRFASKEKVALSHVLSVDDIFINFMDSHSPNQLRSLAQVISVLQQFSANDLGFVVVGRSSLLAARALQVDFRQNSPDRQHPPLPTRIYSILISKLISELEVNEALLDRLLGFLVDTDKYRKRNNKSKGFMPRGVFVTALKSYDLYDTFAERGLALSLYGVNRLVLEMYLCSKSLIHVFSGMRDGEAEFLPYDCLAPVAECGPKHYAINGFTTKYANGKKKKAKWITSVEGGRAVTLVQKISRVVYKLASGGQMIPGGAPLFLSMGVLADGLNSGNVIKTATLDLCKFNRLKRMLEPVLTEADIQELQDIDPFRAWVLEDDFQVGKPWRLTVHQLRRSLSLYASRSGLVSLPSLKRQLQHITEEMTRYYMSGNFFARNLLEEDKEHFSVLYINTQPESQALSFIKNVLGNKDLLFGAAGTWYQPPRDVEITTEEYKDTVKKSRSGLINFTATAVGGCMKQGDCPHRSYGQFSHCLQDCDQSVINLDRLDVVIASQEKHVLRLEVDSVVWKNEKAVLDDYTGARARLLKKKARRNGSDS